MKKLVIALALISGTAIAADERVEGYMRRDGTYVQPSHRTTPDNSLHNNYSTQGNTNPYTGREGTRNPDPQPRSIYDQPRQHRNSNGF